MPPLCPWSVVRGPWSGGRGPWTTEHVPGTRSSYDARSHSDGAGDDMLHFLFALLTLAWPVAQESVRSRPADIAFRVQMTDPGCSESVAVADFNKDGRRDILSA